MTKEDLNKILENHKIWLHCEEGGQRANFQCADLEYIDLSNANLRGADLAGANLRNANFVNADLRNADLRDVRLVHADLKGANIDFSCLPVWCGSL